MASGSQSDECTMPTAVVGTDSLEQVSAVDAIYSVMWGPPLQRVSYRKGQDVIPFCSLWPERRKLESYLDDFNQNELQHINLECCRWAIACGIARLLRALVDRQLVPVDEAFQPGRLTIMHMSCIFRNTEAVELLCDRSASWKKDDKGRTPADVCYCPQTREKIPSLKKVFSPRKSKFNSRASDKQDSEIVRSQVFELVCQPQQLCELQLLLQETNFDVNSERNEDGELLVHVAVRRGLSQVPLLLSAHKLQNMQVDVFDGKGATPLCIVAEEGNEAMADVLICLLGADVNLSNTETEQSPVHIAACHGNFSVLCCLLKRGASCNIEDKNFALPDVLASQGGFQDCQRVLKEARSNNTERVSTLIANGSLLPCDIHESDQYVIDQSGYTPLMVAAQHNRVDMIIYLGKLKDCPLNAQHLKTGQTALSFCAEAGHIEGLVQLLDILAARSRRTLWDSFRISDFEKKWLPLHYACDNGHVSCVEALLKHTEGLVGLSVARRLTRDEELLLMLGQAIQRRQCEVVEPILFNAATVGTLETSSNVTSDSNNVGDVGRSQALATLELEEDDELNPMDEAGNWPLFIAAKNGFIDVVKYLHEPEINVYTFCAQLYECVQLEHQTQMTGYVTCPNPRTGWTPLHVAASYGRLDVVKFLLQFCCSLQESTSVCDISDSSTVSIRMNIDAEGMKGETALELAVLEGQRSVVRVLLDAGASATKPDTSGNLLSCRQFPGVEVLLEQNRRKQMARIAAVISQRRPDIEELRRVWKPPYDHNLRDKHGNSPLMLCCAQGREDVLQILLQSVPPFELTEDFVREFLEVCNIDEDDTRESSDQSTSSPTAATLAEDEAESSHPRRSTCSRLLSENDYDKQNSHVFRRRSSTSSNTSLPWMPPASDPFAEFRGGFRPTTPFRPMTPLPTMLGDSKTASTDLYHDLQSLSFDGNYLLACNPENRRSALHYAVESQNPKVVAQLLQVDQRCVSLRDKDGRTPLHLACMRNRMAVIKQLLNCSLTNPCLRDNDRKGAEDLTSKSAIKLKIMAAREDFRQRAMTVKASMVSKSGISEGNSTQEFIVEGSQATHMSRSSDRRRVGELTLMLRQQRKSLLEHRTAHNCNEQFHHLVDSLPRVPMQREANLASRYLDVQLRLQQSDLEPGQASGSSLNYTLIQSRFEKLKTETGTRHYCPSLYDVEQLD